jgi:hypothetical protein
MPCVLHTCLSVSKATIPSGILILAWLWLLNSVRHSSWTVALLSLVGTGMHEALHAGVGLVLLAKPVSFSLIPIRAGNRWTLGSVGFKNLNIWNAGPVTLAPLLMIWGAILLFNHWMEPVFLAGHYGQWLLAGYVTACALFSSIPSQADVRLGAGSALLWLGIGYGIWKIWF